MSAKKDISKEFDKISDDAKQVQKKRKSLTSRIFKWMCLAVGGSLLIVGGVHIGINYNFLQESLKNQLCIRIPFPISSSPSMRSCSRLRMIRDLTI